MPYSLPAFLDSTLPFAVLPSLFTVGPMALLAWLFPATFGGLAIFLRRGIVLCSVLATISTLYLAQASLRSVLAGTWAATPSAFWVAAAGVASAGLLWSLVRARNIPRSAVRPGPGSLVLLGFLSLASVGVAVEGILAESAQVWRDLFPFCLVVWIGFLCALWKRYSFARAGTVAAVLTSERAMLVALTLACAVAAGIRTPAGTPAGMEMVWAFEPIERGAIVSSPLVAGRLVYVGTIRDEGERSRGVVYAVDRDTGKAVWRFDDGGRMLHMFSTPCLAEGRLYIGEGMHANFACKLYCLDAGNGQKLWEFPAANHIESSPTVADGKVYVGAGDDGLYCLDAVTGKQLWNFRDRLHIDASPVVAGNSVYVSSGVSRRFRLTQILRLDADTGQVRWRRETDLPGWGSPVIAGHRVFFGLGNGRLLTSAAPPEQPAGSLLCVDSTTGETIYRYPVSDAVLARAALDAHRVYFNSRDGFCYALNLMDGARAWQFPLDDPAVTTPALIGSHLYTVPVHGPVFCLNAAAGARVSFFDLAKWNGAEVRVLASPAVWAEPGLEATREIVYVGAEVRGPLGSSAVLYALRGPR